MRNNTYSRYEIRLVSGKYDSYVPRRTFLTEILQFPAVLDREDVFETRDGKQRLRGNCGEKY